VDKYKQQSRLSFTYAFEHDHDTIFFAHFVPYVFTDLLSYLKSLQQKPVPVTTAIDKTDENLEHPPVEVVCASPLDDDTN
jgi:hypothetical protein